MAQILDHAIQTENDTQQKVKEASIHRSLVFPHLGAMQEGLQVIRRSYAT